VSPEDHSDTAWRPSAAIAVLRQRAQLLQQIRAFFAARQVLEVETPALSHAASSEVHLQSMQVSAKGQAPAYLHTSPELAMKRLLCAGSGDIYQLCKVFRAGEQGSRHNPEFTLLEWYRVEFDMPALMQEVADLLTVLLTTLLTAAPLTLTYRQAFLDYAGLDPLETSSAQCQAVYEQSTQQQLRELSKDEWLDLIMSTLVQPRLPRERLVFVTGLCYRVSGKPGLARQTRCRRSPRGPSF